MLNIEELTIADFHHALREGSTTCVEVVTAYLSRIAQYNDDLKALITTNKDALDIARQKDVETVKLLLNKDKDKHASFPPLHGVPIILKDTYSTKDMPTTSGVRALQSLQTNDDAFVVQKLRQAGAIILAKANLHEFSLEGITVSSLGGQTLNPYDRTRTPGGSSGGTAAALAANLGLVGCGGDTMNSLRSPASACSVVGFRPTRGQVSRSGIVPVSETQDVVGPMARTVRDVQVLFDVMRGEDGGDSATVDPSRRRPSPKIGMYPIRIGILNSFFGDAHDSEGSTINNVVLDALHKVESQLKLEMIHLPAENPEWDIPTLRSTADTQSYEFRTVFDAFLQSSLVASSPHRTLESIVTSGEYHKEAVTPVLHNTLQKTGPYTPTSPEYHSRLERIATLKKSVDQCFEAHNLDALVYPHQRQLVVPVGSMVQPRRNGILAALTGRPAICLPAGFSPQTESAPEGVPIGLELMGKPWLDEELLHIAEKFESIIQGRKPPNLP